MLRKKGQSITNFPTNKQKPTNKRRKKKPHIGWGIEQVQAFTFVQIYV